MLMREGRLFASVARRYRLAARLGRMNGPPIGSRFHITASISSAAERTGERRRREAEKSPRQRSLRALHPLRQSQKVTGHQPGSSTPPERKVTPRSTPPSYMATLAASRVLP
jgi:hypothetical protein